VNFPVALPVARLIEMLHSAAATLGSPDNRVAFRCERSTFVLEWPGRHTWQIRLRLAGPQRIECESSPDPDGAHRRDFLFVLDRLRDLARSTSSVAINP